MVAGWRENWSQVRGSLLPGLAFLGTHTGFWSRKTRIWLPGSLDRAGLLLWTTKQDPVLPPSVPARSPVTSAPATPALLVPAHGSVSESLVRTELRLRISPALTLTIHVYSVVSFLSPPLPAFPPFFRPLPCHLHNVL